MVTPFCQTKAQIPDINAINLRTCNCVCQCQLTPPINEYTYCLLKHICRKILKEICSEKQRETYSVFDGGNSMKFETIPKNCRNVCDQFASKNNQQCEQQRNSTGSMQKMAKKTKKPVCRGSSDSMLKKRQGGGDFKRKTKRDSKESVKKSTPVAEKPKGGGGKDTQKPVKATIGNDKSVKDTNEKFAVDKPDKDKSGKDKAEKRKLAQDKLGQNKNDRDYSVQADKRKSAQILIKSKASANDKKQGNDKIQNRKEGPARGARGANIDELERHYLDKRRKRGPCGLIDPPYNRYDNTYRTRPVPRVLTRADEIRPCDYLRTQMEDRYMCQRTMCTPCGPCSPTAPYPSCGPGSPSRGPTVQCFF